MDTLKAEIKKLIVESLRLEDVKAEEIPDAEPLFSKEKGLGLDSIAALELLVALEYRFSVRFPADGTARQHFESVATLASFVQSLQSAAA